MTWTASEMKVIAAARELQGRRVCFVGIGLPNLACSLAKRLVEPALQLVYESGVVGADPERLPLSIGDPTLVTGSLAVMPMFDLFAYLLQGRRVDVAFLGAAQIDRHGAINTTVIGPYDRPKVRLPGSGGACEIAINAGETYVVMDQSPRSFVDKLDFVTSPGHLPGGRPDSWGLGPSLVITQLGIFGFDDDGVMTLRSVHPEVEVADVVANTGWYLRVPERVEVTVPPTDAELEMLRTLDPDRVYLG